MKMVMCCIRDAKAEVWFNPMYFQAKGQAIRSFADAVNDAKSDFFKHPEDYTLFEVGTFDQLTGEIWVHQSPVSLGVGVNFKTEA